ncbi:sigma-70 family RNA polymerase sigma factor [Aquiflexum sp. LQ15W]|uniref:RNA polymerase sigma factor n=1 Tax=Cognataquiflexum nitidum TaxID=2922272 RepID=UPI001F136FDD|nr:sigma-70 family RNA polymerase sigma factor [Cognataquiflexum nitidum]MCH6198494.1 sigma-70 family RNA polymerase sigma factor [Cognataquiflexum nitidum]
MKTFFEAHIWSLKNKLYRMAFLWVKDREVAQDILQAVFEKAWLRKDELQRMENPTGWLVRSLKNESLQHFRISKKFDSIVDFDIEASEESLDRSEEVKLVFRFLESLPEKQREIFQLREVEGLTYEEIGEYLEISLDQVKVNLHRARKTLKDYLMQQKNGK